MPCIPLPWPISDLTKLGPYQLQLWWTRTPPPNKAWGAGQQMALESNPPWCIPTCLVQSLANPDLFEPNLSDDNPDGTIQAYLYWHDLNPDHEPPHTLIYWYFNWFLEQELQILHQQHNNLCYWHNHIIWTDNHICCCTLEWVTRKFGLYTPNSINSIASILDTEEDEFHYLLNWAYAVYTARICYYHVRWRYAHNKNPPTHWLGCEANPESRYFSKLGSRHNVGIQGHEENIQNNTMFKGIQLGRVATK